MKTKICRGPLCNGKRKNIQSFRFRKDKNQYVNICKKCENSKYKEYSQLHAEERKKYMKNWHNNNKRHEKQYKYKNKKKINQYNKNWYHKHQKERLAYAKEYRNKNKEKINKYNKYYKNKYKRKLQQYDNKIKNNLYHSNEIFRLKSILRSRLNKIINGKNKYGSAITDLGCSIEEFWIYLESKFYPNPETNEIMSINNYGQWHIDHIIPLSYFDLTDKYQFKIACNFKNLQPLWAKENESKGNKLPENYMDIVETIKISLNLK